ncbi:pathogenicity locus [Candidatus Gracilibacteria bacterium]|nr:pathogenicity locus [Candidatus Gracilibacteria bacterium]
MKIPGIGKIIARDLAEMGFTKVEDLQGRTADELYDLHNKFRGSVQDPCLLYTYRCVVYYVNTPPEKRDPELLKWWNWKDRKYK